MRIGIDAKRFFRGPVSTRVILQNLLPRLFDQFPSYEWVIFLDKKDSQTDFPYKQKNIHVQYVWGKNTLLSNLFVMPGQIRKWKTNVTVFQTFVPLIKNHHQIVFIHDVLFRDHPEFFTWKERLYFQPMRYLVKNASRIIVATNFVARELIRHGYVKDNSKIDLVPLGVNAKFKPFDQHNKTFLDQVKRKFNFPDEYLLFTGRINVRKNLENLLKALPLLHDQKIPLVIIGAKVWKSPDLKKIINNHGIIDRVILTGSMPEDELAASFAMARIFCFPSFAEGFGLPPLEAMRSGVPVVASNIPALVEVCGNAAIYTDPESYESIADAINRLLENQELAQEKIKSGLENASRFTWDRTAEKFMKSVFSAFLD